MELPDRRKNTYRELEKRVDRHLDAMEVRLHRFFMKALAIFAVIGMTSAIALFGFGINLRQIKETRKDFVYDSCTAQNKRHDNTVNQFYMVAADYKKKHPKEAALIDESVKSNLQLIDSLAPKQNCKKLSEVAVGESVPPPPSITTKTNKKEKP